MTLSTWFNDGHLTAWNVPYKLVKIGGGHCRVHGHLPRGMAREDGGIARIDVTSQLESESGPPVVEETRRNGIRARVFGQSLFVPKPVRTKLRRTAYLMRIQVKRVCPRLVGVLLIAGYRAQALERLMTSLSRMSRGQT